jgi:hypothetical protein
MQVLEHASRFLMHVFVLRASCARTFHNVVVCAGGMQTQMGQGSSHVLNQQNHRSVCVWFRGNANEDDYYKYCLCLILSG